MSETISPKEIAVKLGISQAYCYRMIKQKELPGIRVGRRVIVPRDLWDRWLEQKLSIALANSSEVAQ